PKSSRWARHSMRLTRRRLIIAGFRGSILQTWEPLVVSMRWRIYAEAHHQVPVHLLDHRAYWLAPCRRDAAVDRRWRHGCCERGAQPALDHAAAIDDVHSVLCGWNAHE